jgi:Trypsin-like peptidase domain
MKSVLFCVISGLLSVGYSVAAPGASLRGAVVKTHSYLCALPESDYRGTGILLRQGGSDYVLTSEHVIMWGQTGYCHSAFDQTGKKLTLSLVASDWAEGLALLKVESNGPPSPSAAIVTSFLDEVSDDDHAVTAGFPWTEQNLYTDAQGGVLAKESGRFFLANTSPAIELAHAHGEFGMSGGPVLDSSEEHIMGMLSHQYLKTSSGGMTTVSEYNGTSPDDAENLLLVIPGVAIKHWLNRYFAEPSTFTASFVKEADDQMNQQRVVYASGLKFTSKSVTTGPCAANNASPLLQKALLHGGDPVGIGGGDPVGIGGDAQAFGGAVTIAVEVDRNASSHLLQTEWYLPSRSEWVQSVKDVLVRPASIDLTGLVYRNPDTTAQSRVCMHSLEEFFRKLASPYTSPISVITSSVIDGPLAQALSFMQGRASAIAGLVSEFKASGVSAPTSRWLDRLQLDAEAAGDLMQWELVPVTKFKDYGVFTMNRPFWVELDDRDNQKSIELRQVLMAMDNKLKQMRL